MLRLSIMNLLLNQHHRWQNLNAERQHAVIQEIMCRIWRHAFVRWQNHALIVAYFSLMMSSLWILSIHSRRSISTWAPLPKVSRSSLVNERFSMDYVHRICDEIKEAET
jgi:hypothetical protein